MSIGYFFGNRYLINKIQFIKIPNLQVQKIKIIYKRNAIKIKLQILICGKNGDEHE